MRRLFAVLLGLVAVFLAAQTANAEEYNAYYIDEWNFEIKIPEECIVFTRDVDENHPGLKHFGFTAEAMLEVLESGNIYVDAIESDSAYEIVVVIQDDSEGNMKDWDEEVLESALQSRQTYLESKGNQCISAQIAQHAQTTFLRIDYSMTSSQTTIYVREYYTRYKNTMYGVSLTTIGKELNEEQKDILQSVVDSIRFDAGDPEPGQGAEEFKTYRLQESTLDLEISVPMDGMVITQRMTEDDPVFSQLGILAEEQLAYMTENNVYMQIVLPDIGSDIYVSMVESQTPDFSDLSEETVAFLADRMKEEASAMGMTDYVTDIYVREPVRYIVSSFGVELNGIQSYRVQYYTIYRGTVFNVMLVSYSPDNMAEKAQVVRQIVDSIHFYELNTETEPEPELKTPSPDATYEYRDELSGSVFVIPQNWSQETLESDLNGAKFVPGGDAGVFLLIHSVDMYEETLREYEQKGESSPIDTRAECDRFYFNGERIARALQCEASEIESAVYGENTYYYTMQTVPLDVLGTTVDQPVVYFVRVENGVMYVFQFFGEKDSEYFRDVEKVLGSAQYTHADAQDVADAQQDALWSRFSPLNLLASFVMTVTIYSLPIFIYRWGIRRYPVEKKKAKIITIVYAVFSFVVMIAVTTFVNGEGSASAIWLWSWVNYRVLVGGEDKRRRAGAETVPVIETYEKRNEAENEVTAEESDAQNEQSVVFCRRCGAKLQVSHKFCNKCGAENVLFVMEDQK